MPDKPSYPRRERGHVLVNCRGADHAPSSSFPSFLHLTLKDQFPELEDSIAFVRQHRKLPQNEWYKRQKPVLIDAAKRAAAWISAIET